MCVYNYPFFTCPTIVVVEKIALCLQAAPYMCINSKHIFHMPRNRGEHCVQAWCDDGYSDYALRTNKYRFHHGKFVEHTSTGSIQSHIDCGSH